MCVCHIAVKSLVNQERRVRIDFYSGEQVPHESRYRPINRVPKQAE